MKYNVFSELWLTWSYILRSSKNTVHLSHLSISFASLIIVVISRSKDDCSWNNDFARLRRSWFFLYSKTEASKSWAFCIPTPQKVRYFSKIWKLSWHLSVKNWNIHLNIIVSKLGSRFFVHNLCYSGNFALKRFQIRKNTKSSLFSSTAPGG